LRDKGVKVLLADSGQKYGHSSPFFAELCKIKRKTQAEAKNKKAIFYLTGLRQLCIYLYITKFTI